MTLPTFCEDSFTMPQLNLLRVGQIVKNRLPIRPAQVKYFKFAKECDDIGGGVTAHAEFEVVEVRPLPSEQWARLKIPGSDPPRHLKLAGGEMANLFD